jgi:hypothetical protein
MSISRQNESRRRVGGSLGRPQPTASSTASLRIRRVLTIAAFVSFAVTPWHASFAAEANPAGDSGDPVELLKPAPRQGYYASVTIGAPVLFVQEDDLHKGAWAGTGLTLRAGEMLTERFGLGLALSFQGVEDKQDLAQNITLGMEGQFTILPHLALSGFIGLDVLSIEEKNPPAGLDADVRGTYAGALGLGISYDFFVWKADLSGGLALSPSLRAIYADSGMVTLGGVMVGLDITYWTGRPRNQLDLPPDKAF